MLGVEAAGEVVDVGSEVTEVHPGKQVPFRTGGTWAESVISPASSVALKPRVSAGALRRPSQCRP